MKYSLEGHPAKVKVSAAVLGWTLDILERFRKDAGLRTRSRAVSEALAQWAKNYEREAVLDKVLHKYGRRYEAMAVAEENRAAKMLPLTGKVRKIP